MRFLVLILILSLAAPLFSESGRSTHVIVVHPPMFRASLQPWIEHRSAQGYTIHLLETYSETGENEILHAIRELAAESPLRAILLVGDAYSPKAKIETIPSPLVRARVGIEQDIASDSIYGDLDGDGLPDVAVGRFSVQSTCELDAIIRKTIRYENQKNPGPWLRRINLTAGVGGFSPILDGSIESAARYIYSRTIPPEYDITLTQADVKSPYCPAPSQFRSETIARLNEGSLFWVYMGHGHHRSLDSVFWPEQSGHAPSHAAIFDIGDAQYVSCKNGSPIAIFLACYTGALDAEEDCIAEELHRRETGPVAVFASSRVSMPYGMCVLGIEMIEETFRPGPVDQPLLLGDVILTAKRKSIQRQPESSRKQSLGQERSVRDMVDSLAKMLDPTRGRLEEQRLDHVHLFHLFGDPLLRLPTPLGVKLDAPETAKPNTTIAIHGLLPAVTVPDGEKWASGQCRAVVELAVPKSRNTVFAPKNRVFSLTAESVREFNALYAQANQRVISRVIVNVSQQEFYAQLPIPNLLKTQKGDFDLRVYYETPDSFGLGSRTITVR